MFGKKSNKTEAVTKDVVLERLSKLTAGPGEGDIVSAGMVSDIFLKEGSVMFSLTVPAEDADKMEPLRKATELAVKQIPGVDKVMVALTAEKRPGSANQRPAPQKPAAATPKGKQSPPKGGGQLEISGVKKIIAVSSAKGGVGKSTTSVNLALAMQANGLKVGILDADIYGPSIPRLLNIKEKPKTIEGTRIMKPMEAYGLMAMSIGLLVDEETPMVWRAPMVVSALTQMLRDVAWGIDGELDVLVVDMPPGTGDIQLTMAQQVPLSGAVIVSTPQDLALIDARKGIAMFKQVKIPLLGVVENMSYFLCPSCGEKHEIFGHGGARETAETIGVPFLGDVPLHMDIRTLSDEGRPVVVSEPESVHAELYRKIAASAYDQLQHVERPAPKIIFD